MYKVIQRYNEYLVYDSRSDVVHSIWQNKAIAEQTALILNKRELELSL